MEHFKGKVKISKRQYEDFNTMVFEKYEDFNTEYLRQLPKNGLKEYTCTAGGYLPSDAHKKGPAQWTSKRGLAQSVIIIKYNDDMTEVNRLRLVYSSKNLITDQEERQRIYGRRAYNILMDGINIENDLPRVDKEKVDNKWYHIETIEAKLDYTYYNAKHIDINSFFPYMLLKYIPELTDRVNKFYKERKINPEYKDVLNYSIGELKNHYPGLWENMMLDCKTLIDNKIEELQKSGNKVLATNTDGIWFIGDHYEHSTELGKFKLDKEVKRIRFKSKGSYEYTSEKDGKEVYTPVVRGYTRLDVTKDRKDWSWGDIYQGNIDEGMNALRFVINEGYVFYESLKGE